MLSHRCVRAWLARLALAGLLLASVNPTPALANVATYDVAAFGATVSGKAGDVVRVTVGITSKGPDRFVQRGQGGLLAQTWKFTLPPGTETVRAPETELNTIFGSGGAIGADKCNSLAGGDSPFGPGPYACWSNVILDPGASSKGTFYLKITNAIPDATGIVERWPSANSAPDSDPGNDKAEVVVNPDRAVVVESEPAVAVNSDAAVVGSAAGLPVSLLALAAGVLLLLIGLGGWLYLRRRRQMLR